MGIYQAKKPCPCIMVDDVLHEPLVTLKDTHSEYVGHLVQVNRRYVYYEKKDLRGKYLSATWPYELILAVRETILVPPCRIIETKNKRI